MEIEQAVKCMAALAQESRLRVFRLLIEVGEDGLAAGSIGEHLELPAATTSFHLKELTSSGLIQQTRKGRSLIYSIRPDAIGELLGYLVEDCCQGRPELCRPMIETLQCCEPKQKNRAPKNKKTRTKK